MSIFRRLFRKKKNQYLLESPEVLVVLVLVVVVVVLLQQATASGGTVADNIYPQVDIKLCTPLLHQEHLLFWNSGGVSWLKC